MSQIIRYIWRMGERNPQFKGFLQSNISITCGSSTVTGTLIWQGYLYVTVWGTSTVTGTLSSYVGMYADTLGYSEVIGTLTAKGQYYGVSNGSATVTGTLTAMGYMYTNVLITCGSSEVTGMLTSKKQGEATTDGSTDVTGTLTNGTVYTNKMIGVIINDPNTVGLKVGAINWNSASSGQWYFPDPPLLTLPQPSSYQTYTFLSTSPASPKIIGETITLSEYSIPIFGIYPFNPSLGHKFHYLISDTEYLAGQLVNILDNMIEILNPINDGTYYYGTFPWNIQENGSNNYIYMIYDFRRNVSEIDVVIEGDSTVTGTLIGHGRLLGETNGTTTHIPATDLTAPNLFFDGVAGDYKTRTAVANQIESNNYGGSSFAFWNGVGMHRLEWRYKNETFQDWDNEISIMVKDKTKPLFYVDTMISNDNLKSIIDIDGVIRVVNQGAFFDAEYLERIHLPKVLLLEGPSGYFTLSNLRRLKGKVSLPELTGQPVFGGLGNMNHIFNNAFLVESIYMPKLTRISLQLASRSNFTNMNGLKRAYLPLCQTFIYATGGPPSIFGNVPAGTIMYVHPNLETSNGGLRHASVVYWEDTRGAIIRYVNDFTLPNAVNDLSASGITETGFNLDFTVPGVTVNPIDFYEVWVIDDRTKWRYFIPHSEIVTTGGLVSGLESGTSYRVKIKTADTLYNLSDYSNEIVVRTNGMRSLIRVKTSIVGVLSPT